MAEQSVPGLGDLFALFGSANPFAAISKSFEQFRRGVEEFLKSMENFNATMESLNGVATRVNALFDEVEEPIKAFMPQVTRSIKAADSLIEQLSGPIEKVAPGLSRLADTLSSPVFATMPTDLATFLDSLGELARRIQPLTQMAENAGSLFGLNPLAALRSGSGRKPVAVAPPPPPPPPEPTPKSSKSPAKRASGTKKK